MPVLSRKEIGSLCGKTAAHLSVAINRDKILVLDENGKIDTSVSKNRDTLEKWIYDKFSGQTAADKMAAIDFNFQAPQEDDQEVKKLPKKKPVKSRTRVKKKVETVKTDDEPQQEGGLDSEKKRAEIEFKKAQTELSVLKIQNLKGENVPTELVGKTFSILGQSFLTTYKNGANNFIDDVCHEMRVDAKVKAYMKDALTKIINQSHKDSLSLAKKELRAVVQITAENVSKSDEDE